MKRESRTKLRQGSEVKQQRALFDLYQVTRTAAIFCRHHPLFSLAALSTPGRSCMIPVFKSTPDSSGAQSHDEVHAKK